MEYLIYISTAKKLLDESELLNILTVSRKNNKQNNITGILLYSEGTFIQLLEGESESLKLTYDTIVSDKKHKNIIKLTHSEVDQRSFSDWTMGFRAINARKMESLEGYFDPNKHVLKNDTNHPGLAIIKTFAETNMMVY